MVANQRGAIGFAEKVLELLDEGAPDASVRSRQTSISARKSSSLAAAQHVAHWARRLRETASEHAQLVHLAKQTSWDRNADRSRSVARAIYLRLPEDARLWVRGKEFVAPDAVAIAHALGRDGLDR